MPRKNGRGRGQGARESGGRSVIYGWHSALAALQNPRRTVHAVLVTENAAARLATALPGRALPAPVALREIDRLVGPDAVHQGIAVVCDSLPDVPLDALLGEPLLVVLDQVTDPHNVGAILRSAAAFGATGLVTTERHGAAVTGVLAKAASGALEHVAIAHVGNLARALAELGEHGFTRIGLDSEAEETLGARPVTPPLALVLGAEGRGLRRLTRERCDRMVRLPTRGPIASLNVSNAAAVALYALTAPALP